MKDVYVDFEEKSVIIGMDTQIKDLKDNIMYSAKSNIFDNCEHIWNKFDEYTFICKDSDKIFLAFGFDRGIYISLNVYENMPEWYMLIGNIDNNVTVQRLAMIALGLCKDKDIKVIKYRGKKIRKSNIGLKD